MIPVPSALDHVLALMDDCPCVGVVVPLAGRRGLYGAGYFRLEFLDMTAEVRSIMAVMQAHHDLREWRHCEH